MKDDLVKLLQEILAAFKDKGHLSVQNAATKIDCAPKFIRKHLIDFPNAWRMDGGDIRIPVKDIEAFILKRKIHKYKTPPDLTKAKP